MPYVLPTPEPRRRWYNDVGETQGIGTNLILKALLAQYGAGGGPMAPKNIPNPTYGQTGGLKPDVLFSQPAPTGLGMTPRQDASALKQAIMTPAAPYATQPMLNAQQMQGLISAQQYQKNQQGLDPNSPMNQFLAAQTKRMLNPDQFQQQTQFGVPQLQSLADKADSGDTQAQAFLDYLLSQ